MKDKILKEIRELEKEKEMYSQVIIELEKKLQTQKSELIEKIIGKIEFYENNSDWTFPKGLKQEIQQLNPAQTEQ
jgi:uncharacterized protein Yka (UPF0111/DUF47 family)